MQATENKKLAGVRAKLSTDVEAFLANGGQIHEVQVHENRRYKNKGNVKRAPLTITQKQNQHRWRPKR